MRSTFGRVFVFRGYVVFSLAFSFYNGIVALMVILQESYFPIVSSVIVSV